MLLTISFSSLYAVKSLGFIGIFSSIFQLPYALFLCYTQRHIICHLFHSYTI